MTFGWSVVETVCAGKNGNGFVCSDSHCNLTLTLAALQYDIIFIQFAIVDIYSCLILQGHNDNFVPPTC